MAFTISPDIPPLIYKTGQVFAFQPGMIDGSTPDPTSWAAAGLPEGVTIDADSGKIQGAALVPGVYIITLTAFGPSAAEDEIVLHLGIVDQGKDAIVGNGIVTELDWDVRADYLTVPGVTAAPAGEDGRRGAILYAKRGDRKRYALGFKKDGVLQEAELYSVAMGIKSREPEAALLIGDGTFLKVGSFESARWIFETYFDPDKISSALAEEEDDRGTELDALVEIQAVFKVWPPGADIEVDPPALKPVTCQTFLVRLARDWVDDTLSPA